MKCKSPVNIYQNQFKTERSFPYYMGFTTKLLLAYMILGAGAVVALKRKQKAIGAALILVIVASILILGYLWVTSPM